MSYVQKDGLAIHASLAVILRKVWLKDYEKVLAMEIPREIDIQEDPNGKFQKCIRRVTLRTKAVECDDCLNW